MKAKILLVLIVLVGAGTIFLGMHEPAPTRAPAELHVKPEQIAH